MMRSIHECADRNTVVGTVASASFMPGLLALATSAANVGFPCVVVQPFDWFETLRHQLIRSLPVPSPPLLPRSVWCMSEHQREYGWRRSQLHRVRMWRLVLESALTCLLWILTINLGPGAQSIYCSHFTRRRNRTAGFHRRAHRAFPRQLM